MAINISNSSFLILVTSYVKGMDLRVDFISIALTQNKKKRTKKGRNNFMQPPPVYFLFEYETNVIKLIIYTSAEYALLGIIPKKIHDQG